MRISRITVSGYLLRRILDDPRVAYHFDPITRSMELLTETYALEHALDLAEFRNQLYAELKFEGLHCPDCDRKVVL